MQESTLQQDIVPVEHSPGSTDAHRFLAADVEGNPRGPSAADCCSHARGQGFTLVELLVALAVAAILTVIAVPSFKNLSLSSRLTSTANDMVAAINTARLEAVKRNGSVQLCSDSASANGSDALGSQCAGNGGAVVALSNGNATQVRGEVPGINTQVRFNGNITALRFSGQGLGHALSSSAPYGGTIADICTASLESDNHRLIKMVAGSVVTVTTVTGGCP